MHIASKAEMTDDDFEPVPTDEIEQIVRDYMKEHDLVDLDFDPENSSDTKHITVLANLIITSRIDVALRKLVNEGLLELYHDGEDFSYGLTELGQQLGEHLEKDGHFKDSDEEI